MKILVVFTGGTIGCVRKGEVLSPDNEQKYMLTQMYLDRYGDVDFDTAEPYTVLSEMLMYGKEASNRKQEIDRQHYTIPNQRPKDKHFEKI